MMSPEQRKEIEERVDPAIPERIWLQVYGDEPPPFNELTRDDVGMATWCQDRINESDIEYVRLDAAEARAKAAEGKVRDRERWDKEWQKECFDPLISRLKEMGFEIGYGFQFGRNGDLSFKTVFDATHEALGRLKAAEERVRELEGVLAEVPAFVEIGATGPLNRPKEGLCSTCIEASLDRYPNLAKWLRAEETPDAP